jgi:hypothetical protein
MKCETKISKLLFSVLLGGLLAATSWPTQVHANPADSVVASQARLLDERNAELAELKSELQKVRSARHWDQIEVTISAVAAAGMMYLSYRLLTTRIVAFGPAPQMFGILVGGVSLVPITYGGYNAYKMTVRADQIAGLVGAIEGKMEEIKKAQEILLELGN